VRLVLSPNEIKSVEPAKAIISFVRPDAQIFGASAVNVISRFCHFIFFFASPESGERWIARNSGTFLCSLDDAFALAKRFNTHNFGVELVRRSSAFSRRFRQRSARLIYSPELRHGESSL
jgi:hypothetical protein